MRTRVHESIRTKLLWNKVCSVNTPSVYLLKIDNEVDWYSLKHLKEEDLKAMLPNKIRTKGKICHLLATEVDTITFRSSTPSDQDVVARNGIQNSF